MASQARGWSFVPTAALPEIEAESSGTRARRVSQIDAESASDKRYSVVRELLQTEESYGAAIGLIKTSMLGPLREGDILPEVQLMKIFSCVSELVGLSEGLRVQLQERLSDWTDAVCIGECFAGWSDSHSKEASSFVQYISNFEQSTRALKVAEERLEWQHFIKHWAILLRALGHGERPTSARAPRD